MRVLRPHPLRHYMVESVDYLFAGVRLEIVNSPDQILFEKQQRRLFKSRIVYKLLVVARRATLIPFKILAKVRPVTYKLELPQELSGIHNTFHVSNLNKCLPNENLVIHLEEIQLDDKLHFIEEPIEVMDREVKQLKKSHIPIIKVRWNSKQGPEFTWEREDQFRSKYNHLFSNTS
nr:putative reverse transcriptase domain-containing protein [Tanacetum cinerariifolium]